MPITPPVQIFPQDLNPNIGIGINIPFNQAGVFTSNYLTKDAIKNNLVNFLLTNQGETYMNPTFGGDLRNFLFQQLSENEVSNLKQMILDKIANNFPSINVEQCEILTNPEDNEVTIFLQYSVDNTNINDSVNIEFNL